MEEGTVPVIHDKHHTAVRPLAHREHSFLRTEDVKKERRENSNFRDNLRDVLEPEHLAYLCKNTVHLAEQSALLAACTPNFLGAKNTVLSV